MHVRSRFVLGIIFLTVVAPLWIIFHYITLLALGAAALGEDEKALGDLWASAQRMEGRIDALERVLDAEAPGWRMRQGG